MCFFFFKQKTAYEMRISDWSSDVCSSDLCMRRNARGRRPPRFEGASICLSGLSPSPVGRHALIGYPQVFRGGAGLIEDIDGDPSARIPVAADAEPLRL